MRILQLSDIHFGGEDEAATQAALAYAVAADPVLTVVTGDLTLNGLPGEFRAAEAWLERLPKPLVVTPGNHDTPYWNLPLRALRPFERYRRWIGQPTASRFDRPGLHVRLINTARGAQPRLDWSKGAVAIGLARTAARGLAAEPADALRVVACHHPLMEIAGAPVTGGVHRGKAAARLFCLDGVDLVMSGHVHNPFAAALPFCDGLTYAVGAGTLSRRLRGSPPGFNVLEVSGPAVQVTALGWSGEGWETYREWTLPRRSCPPAARPPARLSRAEIVPEPAEP
jgi:3',5'-cyclic AMP phosphodiesterase CpdA